MVDRRAPARSRRRHRRFPDRRRPAGQLRQSIPASEHAADAIVVRRLRRPGRRSAAPRHPWRHRDDSVRRHAAHLPKGTQNQNGACVYPPCLGNQTRVGANCVPPPPACKLPRVRQQDGSCDCPNPNDVVARDGKRCVPPQKPCDLRTNDVVNGKCVQQCPGDWVRTGKNGKCEPPKKPCDARTNDFYNGQCLPKCPRGEQHTPARNGVCLPPPPKCPNGIGPGCLAAGRVLQSSDTRVRRQRLRAALQVAVRAPSRTASAASSSTRRTGPGQPAAAGAAAEVRSGARRSTRAHARRSACRRKCGCRTGAAA